MPLSKEECIFAANNWKELAKLLKLDEEWIAINLGREFAQAAFCQSIPISEVEKAIKSLEDDV